MEAVRQKLRILIVGGLGFVGGRLAEYLSEEGHHVVMGSRNPKPALTILEGLEVKTIKWGSDEALFEVCTDFDVVIHAAGINSKQCEEDPEQALKFNGLETSRLAKAACRARVKRFVFLSTAHVYANPLVGEISETTVTINSHPYATSNLAGEQALLDAAESTELWPVVVRLSNAFGAPRYPNTNCWSLVVNDLCNQAAQTKMLVMKSDGRQYRDFISMHEVCRVIGEIIVIKNKKETPKVFNLGSGITSSLREMATLIQERSEVVLGFRPPLTIGAASAVESCPTFSYSTKNLSILNIKVIDKSIISEIDNLLRHCERRLVSQC